MEISSNFYPVNSGSDRFVGSASHFRSCERCKMTRIFEFQNLRFFLDCLECTMIVHVKIFKCFKRKSGSLPFGKNFFLANVVIEFISFFAETIIWSNGILTILIFATNINLLSVQWKMGLKWSKKKRRISVIFFGFDQSELFVADNFKANWIFAYRSQQTVK